MRKLSHVSLDHQPLVMSGSATVTEASARMQNSGGMRCILVTDDTSRLVGILTARDVVCRVQALRQDPATTKLADVMTRNPVTISPKQTTSDALHLMRKGNFRHLPLISNGQIMGVVSRDDVTSLEQGGNEEERGLWDHMRCIG